MQLKEVKTSFKSPTREEPYTGEYLMQKFLKRGEIKGEIPLKRVSPTSPYGDKDVLSCVEIWTEPQRQESVTVMLEGYIPLHIDYAGKLSIGWATQCIDTNTNGTYWSHAEDVPYYIHKKLSGEIKLSAILNGVKEPFYIDWETKDDPDPRQRLMEGKTTPIRSTLLKIIKEFLLRQELKSCL